MAVVSHHPPALDPLVDESGVSTAEKAHHCRLLLIRQHLVTDQRCGVIPSVMELTR
jgi:hypothetical protein